MTALVKQRQRAYLEIEKEVSLGIIRVETVALDAITRKLELPAPDGQQNQTESKPAIEMTDTQQGTILVP